MFDNVSSRQARIVRLVALCIIRYAEYKVRFILFEGADVDIGRS